MNVELVDESKDYAHFIMSFELDDDQKEKLLNAFQSLHQSSNQESGKNTVYEMVGFTPKLDENPVPDTDLEGYVKWLFEQHGFSQTESTTISKK